ncbi:MAG: hypothetical protein J6Z12_06495 [Paludibacteraceae bacterium]|nr:hypothetical protein [Paludibacteraceae bacterium]
MKKIILSLLLGITALTAAAQTETKKPHKPLVEIELACIDSMHIMDEAAYAKFEPVYREYAAQRQAIRREIRASKKAMRAEGITDADAKAELDKMLAGQVKLAELSQQYADQFLTILTPQQVVKVYRVHDVLRNRLMNARRAKRAAAEKNKQ